MGVAVVAGLAAGEILAETGAIGRGAHDGDGGDLAAGAASGVVAAGAGVVAAGTDAAGRAAPDAASGGPAVGVCASGMALSGVVAVRKASLAAASYAAASATSTREATLGMSPARRWSAWGRGRLTSAARRARTRATASTA
jgi:hypothetical protein